MRSSARTKQIRCSELLKINTKRNWARAAAARALRISERALSCRGSPTSYLSRKRWNNARALYITILKPAPKPISRPSAPIATPRTHRPRLSLSAFASTTSRKSRRPQGVIGLNKDRSLGGIGKPGICNPDWYRHRGNREARLYVSWRIRELVLKQPGETRSETDERWHSKVPPRV